jgi:hypothetical protein
LTSFTVNASAPVRKSSKAVSFVYAL